MILLTFLAHVIVVPRSACAPYSRNGARFSLGVVPRELRLSGRGGAVPGSTEVRRGVCIPDGVDAPLVFPVADEEFDTLEV